MSTSAGECVRGEGVTVISGARNVVGQHTCRPGSLQIAGGKIQHIDSDSAPGSSGREIDLEGFLLLPGLINAHDHLQYALHPRLGNPPYRNYVEWGDDIHATLSAAISHYNSVPKAVRLWWGGLRNLLCGVTTVCHHDPFWPALSNPGFPLNVVRNYAWAHSVKLSPDIRQRQTATPGCQPFIVHACEGKDELARRELSDLDRSGMLNSTTVIVHGLALDAAGIALLKAREASLILCLSSNQFLYGCLPNVKELNAVKGVALGNDSPLTATGDLLDEVRFAITRASIPADRAYQMITERPAAIMRLSEGQGYIRESGCADFVAVRDNGDRLDKRLCTLSWRDIEFVMIKGNVQLASEDVWLRLSPRVRYGLEPLCIEERVRWLRAPVRELVRQAEAFLGVGMVRLGERVVRSLDTIPSTSPTVAHRPSPRLEERL